MPQIATGHLKGEWDPRSARLGSSPMRSTLSLLFAAVLLLRALPPAAHAEPDPRSIFPDARTPASELDLKLAAAERRWERTFVDPASALTTPTRARYPLLVNAAVLAEFRYRSDHIEMIAWITNLEGFLALSPDQRKTLVKQSLDAAVDLLLAAAGAVHDKGTGRLTGLTTRHLRLCVVLDHPNENNQGQWIRLDLPQNLGLGQAGYADGYFVFSRDYFLSLRVSRGRAIVGDSGQFITEPER